MAEVFNFEKYQIPQTGVDSSTKGTGWKARDLNMVMGWFGHMNYGPRMSHDYTRTTLDYKFKDDISHWATLNEDTGIGQNVMGRGIAVEHNPLIWGQTRKWTRDDQFVRMRMYTSIGAEIDSPAFDVMDEKRAKAASIILASNATIKNWPMEGWRSFGGKYDFPAYIHYGGVLK
jgi:hypothetical protein